MAVSIAMTMIAMIYLTASHQTKNMLKEMFISLEDVARAIYAGIRHPMSVGDSQAVQRQLLDIKKERKDIDVFICDFDRKIIYATQEDRINSKASDLITNKTFLGAVDRTLKTGEDPMEVFEEETHGKKYITTVCPILNNPDCYHCHGSSRKVLGGMITRKAAEKSYAGIAHLRSFNILISILGICAVTLLIYIILYRLVRQPLVDFTDKINELTAKIPEGDYSTRIDIKRRDEIGELITSFNHMAETLEFKNHALQKAHKSLSDANKELEAFAYSVSHDLRAPLRGIDGFSKIVLDEYSKDLDDSCRHYLSRIRNNTSRMSVLIDDILTFSRAGRTELQLRPVKLTDMVKSVLSDFREDIESRGISVQVENLPEISCDTTMMQSVFSNLISNSIKFTRNMEKPRIVIGFDKDKNAIFVRDNGIGFDMQYHDKIFGVFQRLHLPEEYDGTGIGLAIVRRIVERHHGKVWAESTPGEQTTFFIKLHKGE